MLYVAAVILPLGLAMFIRGLIYTLRPDGKMAEKRQRRNLKVGFTTDMKVFGRKVRRMGFVLSLVGAGLIAWHFSAPPAPDEEGGKPATSSGAPEKAPPNG